MHQLYVFGNQLLSPSNDTIRFIIVRVNESEWYGIRIEYSIYW
jgi:hypothetical protein